MYLDKFNPEVELFAGHLVVCIQCDVDVVLGSDGDRERLSHHVAQVDALADIEVFGAGELSDLNGDDLLGVGQAVGFFRHEMNIDCLADFHIRHRLVETADHHTGAADKLQGLAPVIGGIKLSAVVEGSSVMDSDVFAGVFAFQDNLRRTASAASAAAAALAAAFFTTALFTVVTAASAVFFPIAVMAALVAFAVVMMVTVCARRDEFAAQIGLDRLVGVTFRACDNSDPCICQGIQGTSAQAAADQDFNGLVGKKSRQSAVADPVGSDDLAGLNCSVLPKCWKMLPFS